MLEVCLAAWIPATRATARTSPLVIAPEAIFDAVAGSMVTRHRATARRCEGSLAVTSTIRARPSGSRCVNSEAIGGVYGRRGRGPGRGAPLPIGDYPPIWLIERAGRM